MAENQASDDRNSRAASAEAEKQPSSGVGPVASVFIGAALIAAKIWHAFTHDGVLAAAGRQGLDELATALKPLPDSIQVAESGTLWNPTQGEIAADRQQEWDKGSYSSFSRSGPPHPWPSELARDLNNQPSSGHGNENGKDGGFSM